MRKDERTSGDNRQELRARNIGVIISSDGFIVHPFVKIQRVSTLGARPMYEVHGIVVHQTGGSSLQGALASAASRDGIGAHFYIDLDGTIYQTASLDRSCGHVGFLKPRCLAEHRCTPNEAERLRKLYDRCASTTIHREEMKKSFPDRYPSNNDSIGIELVGDVGPKDAPEAKKAFHPVTQRQNELLKWLIPIICRYHMISSTEIYRHPVLSRKNPTEAATAEW